MFEIDFATGVAYKKGKSYKIRVGGQGCAYVIEGLRKVVLTDKNSKLLLHGNKKDEERCL